VKKPVLNNSALFYWNDINTNDKVWNIATHLDKPNYELCRMQICIKYIYFNSGTLALYVAKVKMD